MIDVNGLKFQLPRIYPITDAYLSGISHAEQIRRLIDGNARIVQIREKRASSGEFFEAARDVVDAAQNYGLKVIINDRVDIAIALKADGIHLGQDDLPPEQARKLLGDKAVIGYSTHSFKQALAAVELPIDYIAIGPIFATATKEDPEPAVGLNGLREVRDATGNFPLVAIGGITLENIESVFDAGVDSAAIIAEIIRDPEKIAEKLNEFSALASSF